MTVSQSGTTARLVSRFRPDTTVVACLLREDIGGRWHSTGAWTPLLMPLATNTDDLVTFAVQAAEDRAW